MRRRHLLAALLAASFIAACGEPEAPTAEKAAAAPTPDIEATVVAEVQARIQPATTLAPSGEPLPPADREAIATFASSHGQIIADWEQFHVDLDAWRSGLVSCEVSSIEVRLRQFAADIGDVAAMATALPRGTVVRQLADKLVVATEAETAAARHLRDSWTPDDPSVFDNVDLFRSSALDLRTEVQDGLSDLQESTSVSARSSIAAYESAFNSLSADWDEFRDGYDTFRTQEADLSPAEVVARLGGLVEQFRDIVVAVRELPTDNATRGVSATLAEAAEAEDLAFRKLRDTHQRPAVEEAADPPGQFLEAPGFAPMESGLFDAFGDQLASSNALRRQSVQALADVSQSASKKAEADVQQFAQQHDLLVGRWDKFHSDYDQWRRTEGACDRSKALATLGQFASEFSALTRRARDLPGGAILATLRELMVEAAELEEEGVRELRNGWRPFDVEVYKNFDSRRNFASRHLRQVVAGLDDLLVQHSIEVPQ